MLTKKQRLQTDPYKLPTKNHKLQTARGFTLIELLLAMAIIAILSGAILMNLGSQRKKANQSKLLAEFSGVLQPIMMCRSDGGAVNPLASGNSGGTTAICSISSHYGMWPTVANTDFATAEGGSGYEMDADFSDGNWFFYADDTSVRICCNSASSKCQQRGAGTPCTATDPAL